MKILEAMQELITLIKDIGFPIVMCLLMLKANQNQEARHTEQIGTMCKSLDENTKVIAELHKTLKRE